MTRSALLTAIRKAEAESAAAVRLLGVLRKLVETVLSINGDVESGAEDAETTERLAKLIRAPKPVLKAWAVVCSNDPLLACLIKARKDYSRTDRARRGKGAKCLEVSLQLSYRYATDAGFKGSPNQWEALVTMR